MSPVSIGQAPATTPQRGGGAGAGPAPPCSTSPGGAQEAPPPPRPPPPPVDVVLPLHLASVGNRREHEYARARRTRREIAAVLGALARHAPPPLPLVVTLVRVGWNRLDVDGLVSSAKAPIDAVAEWIGVNDRDRRLFWRLAQSITREKRTVRTRRGLRSEAASSLRILVRPWHPSDGDDPLRVLAVAPREEAP